MKNLIFVFLCCILFSCKSKIIENRPENNYSGMDEISKSILSMLYTKKTGVFIYPKVGYTLGLKKGKLDGEMSLIREQDTLYYCNYKNNKPLGKFINKVYFTGRPFNYLPLINIQFAVNSQGRGFYNKNHKKEGFWDESGYCFTEEGTYENGLKHGIWIEDCFNDGTAYYTAKITRYSKGVVVRSNIKRSTRSIEWLEDKF